MKLRNKKTKKLGHVMGNVRVYTDAGWEDYGSLAELNDEWEDYKPKEPLIKDEKVRKAVRAWAEANGIKPQDAIEFNAFEHRLIWVNTVIEFNDSKALLDLDEVYYSIPELCGEEEE